MESAFRERVRALHKEEGRLQILLHVPIVLEKADACLKDGAIRIGLSGHAPSVRQHLDVALALFEQLPLLFLLEGFSLLLELYLKLFILYLLPGLLCLLLFLLLLHLESQLLRIVSLGFGGLYLSSRLALQLACSLIRKEGQPGPYKEHLCKQK